MNIDLKALATELKYYEGVKRKEAIGGIVKCFHIEATEIVASFGEDAAVIRRDHEALLFAADGVWGKLMRADPEWSGYVSVLVNVHDIAAMGGRPLAMVDVFSTKHKETFDRVCQGMSQAIEKFGVPIVGGHMHPDTDFDSLDVAILGVAGLDSVIYSSTAKPGDYVVVGVDLDGHPHPSVEVNFDSTSFKDPEVLRRQLESMPRLGDECLVTAGKDISNPGMLGTLGMLIECSGVGAEVDIEAIPVPESLDMTSWLKMYPGMGFVVTTREPDAVVDVFEEHLLTGACIGRIIEEPRLDVNYAGEKATIFDLSREIITGIKGKGTR